MTNVAGQRIEPAVEAASALVEMRGTEKVYRSGKPEYAALRRWTWRPGRGDAVTAAGPPGARVNRPARWDGECHALALVKSGRVASSWCRGCGCPGRAGRCGGSHPSSASPGPAFPGTPAGAQARWLVHAIGSWPIPDAAIRAHFAAAILATTSPADLNTSLAEWKHLGLVSVTSTRPEAVVFVVSVRGAQRFRVDLTGHGRGPRKWSGSRG